MPAYLYGLLRRSPLWLRMVDSCVLFAGAFPSCALLCNGCRYRFIFNRYTNLIYSSVIVFSLIRFAFDDVHVALLNRKNRAEKKPDDDVRILKALEFAEKGEYKQACRLFLRLLKDNPLNATACFGVGVCLVKLGKEKFGLGYIEKSAFLGNAEARKYLYDVAGRGGKGALRAL